MELTFQVLVLLSDEPNFLVNIPHRPKLSFCFPQFSFLRNETDFERMSAKAESVKRASTRVLVLIQYLGCSYPFALLHTDYIPGKRIETVVYYIASNPARIVEIGVTLGRKSIDKLLS